MNVIEELLDVFNRLQQKASNIGLTLEEVMANDAIYRAIQELEWISVEDELPKVKNERHHGVSVLVAYLDSDPERYFVTEVSYNPKKGFTTVSLVADGSGWHDTEFLHQITHWKYLPEPPTLPEKD